MYLSRVVLDLWCGRSALVVGDFYAAHAFIASACRGNGESRVLFRVEQEGTGVWLLVQSDDAPDWETAAQAHNVCLQRTDVKLFDPVQLVSGMLNTRFRLRANPVRTVKDIEHGRLAATREGKPQRMKNVRVPLQREDEQREWLTKKLSHAGIEVQTVRVHDEGPRFKGGPATRYGKNALRIYSVRFDGTGRIVNTDRTVSAIVNGVGPAKGFGFGLLSVMPIS